MIKTPKVSVIMPNFNYADFIGKSIESILGQTMSDFELIIVDDASTDYSYEEMKKFQSDKRVNIIRLSENAGNYKARNIGIAASKADYIAVMDADDIANLERLKIQYDYLKNNSIACIGSQGTVIDQSGNTLGDLNKPVDPDYLKIAFLKNNFIIHPSLFYNKQMLREKKLDTYNENLSIAADYEFAVNCAFHFGLRNIPERLINYRLHKDQITSTKNEQQVKTARQVRLLQISRLGIVPTAREMYVFNHFMENTVLREEELDQALQFAKKILHQNEKIKIYNQELLQQLVQQLFSEAQEHSRKEAWTLESEVIKWIEKKFPSGSRIIEFGSGGSTDVLLTNYKVVSIEHDFRFVLERKRDHKIYLAPIKNGWYDPEIVEGALNSNEADLIIVDGPPGTLRGGILENTHYFKKINCPVIFDDIDRPSDRATMDEFCRQMDYKSRVIDGTKKKFAICEKKTMSLFDN